MAILLCRPNIRLERGSPAESVSVVPLRLRIVDAKRGMQRTKDTQKSDIATSRLESQTRALSEDSHLADGARYTVHEWQQWLGDRELSAKDMQQHWFCGKLGSKRKICA